MSISNTSWSSVGLNQDQNLYRKLLREGLRESGDAGPASAQLTITVTASPQTDQIGQAQTGTVQPPLEFGRPGLGGILAALSSAGFTMAPPPPSPTDDFANNLSTLFSALETGDTKAAKSAAEKLDAVLATFDQATSPDATSTSTVTSASRSADGDGDADTSTEGTNADVTSDTSAVPDFISSLKTIVSAVDDGDFDTAKTEASTLSETIAGLAPDATSESRPRPPMIGDIMGQVAGLLASVDTGNSDAAQSLASALRSALPDLDTQATTADGKHFDTDLAALLNAVEAGNADGAKAAAKTIETALSGGAPPAIQEAPPTPPNSNVDNPPTAGAPEPASDPIETALSSLDALAPSSPDATSADAFLQSLKDLLESLKSGTNVDQKLQSVVDAYTADQPAAVSN